VFAQGSYCNRTNVREDSDVDVMYFAQSKIYWNSSVAKALLSMAALQTGFAKIPDKSASFSSALLSRMTSPERFQFNMRLFCDAVEITIRSMEYFLRWEAEAGLCTSK
jgi:hypothetical protein